MKVLICHFSGTGNTKKIVDEYAKHFVQLGNSVQLHAMEKGMPMLENVDMLGIAYPVHSFNAPSIVVDFVKKLPQCATKMPTFVVNTSGEPFKLNNVSSILTTRLLKKRGYNVFAEYHYCMPYNMIFRHSEQMAFDMWRVAQQLAPLDVADIVEQKPHKLQKVFCGRFLAWIMRIEHFGGRFNGKKYKVKEGCIHCNKCVNVCPTNNISVAEDGKFKFGKKCLMCMRCSFGCPTNAIKIGWFEGWKVNGAYKFEDTGEPNPQKYNKSLTKAYSKYFDECNKRIANATNTDD